MIARQTAFRLVALVREEAVRNGYTRVDEIVVRLGTKVTLNADELTMAFDEFRTDNLIKNAKLIVKKTKTLARCRYCGNIFEVLYIKNRCKKCGNIYLEFINDTGISLERIAGE